MMGNGEQWYRELFASIDDMNTDAFTDFLTEDASFIYGSQPAVEGKTAVRESVRAFFESLAGIGHDLHGTWELDDVRFCQGTVTYTLGDDRSVSVPFLNKFSMEGEKIREYQVFVDPTPLAG